MHFGESHPTEEVPTCNYGPSGPQLQSRGDGRETCGCRGPIRPARDESLLVDEAAQAVGSSELRGVEVADEGGSRVGLDGARWLGEGGDGASCSALRTRRTRLRGDAVRGRASGPSTRAGCPRSLGAPARAPLVADRPHRPSSGHSLKTWAGTPVTRSAATSAASSSSRRCSTTSRASIQASRRPLVALNYRDGFAAFTKGPTTSQSRNHFGLP